MALQIQGNSGIIQEVAGTGFRAANAHIKPIEYGVLGHYRTSVRFSLVASQAANSRLFEVRNTHATNLIVPTRLSIKWIQTAAHTAAILDSLDFYKLTAFTVSSTTGTVTPTASSKRASMAASPGGAAIRNVTVAGAAAGMTGGTSTKDANTAFSVPQMLLLAVPTSGFIQYAGGDLLDDVNSTHPFVFVQNEGFLIENRVLLGVAAGSDVTIDFSWAEVVAY